LKDFYNFKAIGPNVSILGDGNYILAYNKYTGSWDSLFHSDEIKGEKNVICKINKISNANNCHNFMIGLSKTSDNSTSGFSNGVVLNIYQCKTNCIYNGTLEK